MSGGPDVAFLPSYFFPLLLSLAVVRVVWVRSCGFPVGAVLWCVFLFPWLFPPPFGGPLVRVLSSLSGLFASQCVFTFLVRGPWRGIESDQQRLRALPSLGGSGDGGAEPVALLARFSTCLCFLIEGRKGTLGAIGGGHMLYLPFCFSGLHWLSVGLLRPS